VSVQIDDATTRRALRELARLAPRSLPFPELARAAGAKDAPALRDELLDLWLATGGIDLHVREPAFAVAPGERPLACPVARWHGEHGGPITNRWHHEVRLEDAPLRRVLALLDGTRTLADIAPLAGCEAEVARAGVAALAAAALIVR
jgi:hypothetical protein